MSMSQCHDRASQWVATAHRLREVRQACLLFLDQWAIGQLLGDAAGYDRVARDLKRHEAGLADTAKHDWSVLYRGSVLDD
jgi:ATP-dependent Clp protease ATP-binding subunit ClpA